MFQLFISLATASMPEPEVFEIPAFQPASAEELAMRLEVQSQLDDDQAAMARSLALYELMLVQLEDGDEIARTRIAAGNLANRMGDLERARMHLTQAQWHPVYGAEAQAVLADLDR